MRNNGFFSACSSFSASLLPLTLAVLSGCGSSPAPAQSPWEADPDSSAAPVASASAPPPSASASAPAFVPPTPGSVTAKNPGGDAADPERAALERLAGEPWGFRKDRWDTLHVHLVDWKNWKRVRLYGHPTRVTHRYGDKHYAVDTILYTPSDGPSDPASCLAKFSAYATTTAQTYGVQMSQPVLIKMNQIQGDQSIPMLVELRDGHIEWLMMEDDYVGAIAVYTSWPGTCLVRGFAVQATRHRELATKIRDRWVREGASQLRWAPHVKETPPTESR